MNAVSVAARAASTLLFALSVADTAQAHYNMLLPAVPYAKKGDTVTFIYQWGHPFEHELFDAPVPASLVAFTPDGRTLDLASRLKEIHVVGAANKKVAAFQLPYIPVHRGDHTFVLRTPPIFLDGSSEFVQDIVKVILHVTTQKGWDADQGESFRIVPLTRPYGLYPGMVFRARILMESQPFTNALVEYERYNPMSPKELPPDELITFKTKTDNQGIVSVAFPDPGWWALTAHHDAGTREHKGKQYPVRQRVTLWVHVDEKR